MKRRILSLVLALAMVLSMVSVASAQETAAIDVVEVTVGEVVAGQAVPAVTVPEGANYTADEVYWYDSATGESVTVLADGGRYQMSIHVYPKEGYALSDETVALLNGEEAEDYWYDDRWGDNYITIMKFFSFQQIIDKADVLVGEAVPGQAVPEVTVPEGVNYELDEVLWVEEATGESVTELADGKRYEMTATLKPLAGYGFNEDDVDLTINGSRDEVDYSHNGSWSFVKVGKSYSFCTPVNRVDVSFDTPQADKAAPVPSVAGDAPYVLTNWRWTDANDWSEDADVLAAGGKYMLTMEIETKDGYDFNGEVVFFCNGEEYSTTWAEGTSLQREYEVSFRKKIDKVELFYDTPEAGKEAPEVKVPEGAPYIAETHWWNSDNEEVTVLEELQSYDLFVGVIPAEGYEFDMEAAVYVNGEETDNCWVDDDWAEHYQSFTFRKKIDKVELPGAPEELKAGDSLEIGLGDMGDVPYTMDIFWMAFDDEMNYGAVGDTAEEGTNYAWVVQVFPKEGYEFAADVEVTVGGKKTSSQRLFTDVGIIQYTQFYLLGQLQMIDKVELTVEAPAVGDKEGKAEVSADAPYVLEEMSWAAADVDDVDKAEIAEAIEKGQYVWLGAGVLAKEGYIFSPEVQVYVNGQLQEDALKFYTEGGVVLLYGLGQIGVEAPPTGDAGVALYAVLAVLALCGTAVMIGRKKTIC